MRGNVLKNCKVFERFSPNLRKESTTIMEEVRFSPEDEIFSENLEDDSAIYIITKGSVDICF